MIFLILKGDSLFSNVKSKFSKNTADDFETCHVFYDLDNNCEAIELFSNINIKIDEDTI